MFESVKFVTFFEFFEFLIVRCLLKWKRICTVFLKRKRICTVFLQLHICFYNYVFVSTTMYLFLQLRICFYNYVLVSTTMYSLLLQRICFYYNVLLSATFKLSYAFHHCDVSTFSYHEYVSHLNCTVTTWDCF